MEEKDSTVADNFWTWAKNQSLVEAGDFRNESSADACVKEGDWSSGFAKSWKIPCVMKNIYLDKAASSK